MEIRSLLLYGSIGLFHLSPVPRPLFLIPYPLFLIPYPLSLIPHPFPLVFLLLPFLSISLTQWLVFCHVHQYWCGNKDG